jgi:RNA polymerase sigma factor (sigma-70 family)
VVGRLTDGELLEHFARPGGETAEAAFAALVERHGPMVMQVCRALQQDAHDAEDAFQATFLVLARRAKSIREPGLLANWLYGVAHRTARKARSESARRRSRETREEGMSTLEVPDRENPQDQAIVHNEQIQLVHEELNRLPERQRVVVVLCCLEGLTVEETASRLRCTSGSVRGRLAQARSRLRDRLARRGVAVPAAVLSAALSTHSAPAAVAAALKQSTIEVALSWLGGAAVPTGAAPEVPIAIAKNVSRVMRLSEWKLPATILLAVAAGLGGWAHMPIKSEAMGAFDDRRALVEGMDWALSAVDPERGWISLESPRGQRGGEVAALVQFQGVIAPGGLTLEHLEVAPDVRVSFEGKAVDLSRLRVGMAVAVELDPDRFAATGLRVRASGAPSTAEVLHLEEVDVAGRTISVAVGDRPWVIEKLGVDPEARITLLEVGADQALRLQGLEFQDLRPGMPVSLTLAMGRDGRLFVRSVKCARIKPVEERSR